MKIISIYSLLVIAQLFSAFPVGAERTVVRPINQVIKISPVQKRGDGCGCGYYDIKDRKRKVIFHNDVADETLMNINGKDVLLNAISPKQQKGQFSVNQYRAADYRITVELRVTKKDYEGVEQVGTITVSNGNKKVIKKVKGGCGC